MAYSTDNPPRLISQGVGTTGSPADVAAGRGAKGGALWVYVSGDPVLTVKGAGYITNGAALGMKVNDAILIVDSATPLLSVGVVDAVAADGAAELT